MLAGCCTYVYVCVCVPQALDTVLATADEDQVRMMEERVILLDEQDNVIGHASKKESHLNTSIEAGMLHRAFSVFLFTPDGSRLMLQQRSPAKITFPHFWANTCCSHPLYRKAEMIQEEQMGVKNAAIRKLEQELGIPPEDVPPESFTFLTRVHYKANGGSDDGIWGEHEIDYILICRPTKEVRVNINANEVAQVRYFDRQELREWVRTADTRGDLISPWFKIIEESLLHKWWDAMDAGTLHHHADNVIHRAPEMLARLRAEAEAGARDSAGAGAGSSSSSSSTPPAVRKQGAYGKITTHKHSIASQLLHGSEVLAALRYKLGLDGAPRVSPLPASATESERWCEDILGSVSRSFALVIKQLPPTLRTAVCNFYLVLRGLDTVEDDMENFTDVAVKVRHLRAFHEYLRDPTWTLSGIGEGDERALLQQFNHVTAVFRALPKATQDVIADITARMGDGMALYCSRNLTQGTTDVADYNLYCHFVAGLVGEGLSRLFVAGGFEQDGLADQVQLANDMGLFLQKTNIIRDYLEDFVEGRAFWPRDIWGQYANDLGDFANNPSKKGIECLNHLVADAMTHAPACLKYLTELRDPAVLRFCAIPQLMAIATLDELTSNPLLFTGVVKIRKGMAVKLLSAASSREQIFSVFLQHSRSIMAKVSRATPTTAALLEPSFQRVQGICLAALPFRNIGAVFNMRVVLAVGFVLALLLRFLHARSGSWEGHLPRLTDATDVVALVSAIVCCAYLVAFTGVPAVLMDSRSDADVETAFKAAGVSGADLEKLGHVWHEKEAEARGLPPGSPLSATSSEDATLAAPAVAVAGVRQRRRS